MATSLASSPGAESATEGSIVKLGLPRASMLELQAVIQEMSPRLRCLSQSLDQLQCLHTKFPLISHFQHSNDGSLRLVFSHLHSKTRLLLHLRQGNDSLIMLEFQAIDPP